MPPAPPDILPPETAPVEVRDPQGGPRTPLVFASPHSGRGAPADFLRLLRPPAHSLRKGEDAHVDRLFAAVPDMGAPLVAARFCRAFLDANREPAEIDPAMLDSPAPAWINASSPRVANGLGVIPRLTVEGETIHRRQLTLDEAQERVERFHAPYHRAVAARLEAARAAFGLGVLVDCHSMPAAPDGRPAPDIVLGDRFGSSCDPRVSDAVERALRAQDFTVQRNVPYAGGYTTAHYGRPRQAFHAVQIEICRALYMDEETLEPLPGAFEALAARLSAVAGALTALDWPALVRAPQDGGLRAAE